MKNLFKYITLICVLAASSASQAAQTYAYTITFSPKAIASGTFTGEANGDLITSLSNITASLNGVAFHNNGNLYAASWSNGTWKNGGAVASIDGKHNNFQFTDVNYPANQQYSGELASFAQYSSTTNANNVWLNGSPAQYYSNNSASWTLHAITPVPETASYAMLLVGLGLFGFMSRRRKAVLMSHC
ncbi:PEP-CTERM sorting domain-containing protein [Glaciimonas immobilis]|uniref:Ice-binding protein C-terminal domain-containing protein n=1 Tax=Glaciimonas immobilis TaxID=728004 RepID=A0A840RLJ1_9BURK|nr:PEP-CTERM sorting domain-containing protein [Glaciimonas immobilis]KAF3998147.1 PEP-CTERM sorting domain-containing protein [Glaciimonas immobilis]MBB5199147.1 hypothetical protein [Glaciimonas immobilis]